MTYVAFQGHSRLASGPLQDVACAVKAAGDDPLVFGEDGRVVDLDLRGDVDDVRARYAPRPPEPRGRGRPRLGVVPREVTLLPRHWDWLNAQPGGASVALRKLVEDASRRRESEARARRDAAYRFMSAMAGDLPGFEGASRALFAGDRSRLQEQIAGWPSDVREHILAMTL